MSAARSAGDFRVLYPKGVKRIDQVPWPLQEAINHALSILMWHENYTGDDLPHSNLWDDSEAVEDHFRRVRERRDAERDGGADRDDDEASELMSNDLASVFKK